MFCGGAGLLSRFALLEPAELSQCWGALQEYLPLGRFNELETRSFEGLMSELRGSIQKGIDFVHKSKYLLHSCQILMSWERRSAVAEVCNARGGMPQLMHVCYHTWQSHMLSNITHHSP